MLGRLVSINALKLPAQDRALCRLPLLLSLSTLLVLTYPTAFYVAILHCDAQAVVTETRMKRTIPMDNFTAQPAMGRKRRKQTLLSTSPYLIAT
jgi:hypothetical protein